MLSRQNRYARQSGKIIAEVMGEEWMTKPVPSDRRLGPRFERGEEAIGTRGGEGFVAMV